MRTCAAVAKLSHVTIHAKHLENPGWVVVFLHPEPSVEARCPLAVPDRILSVLPTMLGTVVIDVVEAKELRFRFAAAGAIVPAIGHECVVSQPFPIFRAMLALGLSNYWVLHCAVMALSLLGQQMIPLRPGVIRPHVIAFAILTQNPCARFRTLFFLSALPTLHNHVRLCRPPVDG